MYYRDDFFEMISKYYFVIQTKSHFTKFGRKLCMPAFYGHVSLQNSNPTNKKDGFPESKYSPGGALEPEKKCEDP